MSNLNSSFLKENRGKRERQGNPLSQGEKIIGNQNIKEGEEKARGHLYTTFYVFCGGHVS